MRLKHNSVFIFPGFFCVFFCLFSLWDVGGLKKKKVSLLLEVFFKVWEIV